MGSEEQDERSRVASEGSDTARLETFADGVIAIAITLLILDVKVPEVHGAALRTALARQWPSYAGYAVSFLTIGVIWVNHHHMFKLIARTTHAFLVMNVVFLMTISFLPWPTALVAHYLEKPNGRGAATIAYGCTMICPEIANRHLSPGRLTNFRHGLWSVTPTRCMDIWDTYTGHSIFDTQAGRTWSEKLRAMTTFRRIRQHTHAMRSEMDTSNDADASPRSNTGQSRAIAPSAER